MIEVFEGRLGGGKSYTAVCRIVRVLAAGGTVATNIELNWLAVVDYCKRKFGVIIQERQFILLDDDSIPNFHEHTPGGTLDCPTLVVIDEAQLYWNSRDFKKTDEGQRELLKFLTQSRKACTDVIFISQHVKNMDTQFMRLVQYIWRFRDMERFRIPVLGIKWPFKQILECCFDFDGYTLFGRRFVRKDTEIFKLYETGALLQPFERSYVTDRIELEKVAAESPLKDWRYLASVFAVVCLVEVCLRIVGI